MHEHTHWGEPRLGYCHPAPCPPLGFGRALAARRVIVREVDAQIGAFRAAGTGPAKRADAADGSSVIERLLGMQDDHGKPLSRRQLQVRRARARGQPGERAAAGRPQPAGW